MEYFISSENLENYIILPKTFDWDLVDQELGFGKLFETIPKDIYLDLKNSHENIFRLLTKSAVHFSFVLSIPKLKVHINSTGINQFEQDKLKTAPWWDVRDLGLSLLSFANKLLSEALSLIAEEKNLAEKLPFFKSISKYIKTPEEFENIYSIKHSPEVFQKLQKFIDQALTLKVSELIGLDCLDQILENEELAPALKIALVYYSLYYASLLPSFVFLQNAVVVQYEELPWQKSQVLDAHSKLLSGQNFLKLAENSMKIITTFIKKNKEQFPCYKEPLADREIQSRESGLYLI